MNPLSEDFSEPSYRPQWVASEDFLKGETIENILGTHNDKSHGAPRSIKKRLFVMYGWIVVGFLDGFAQFCGRIVHYSHKGMASSTLLALPLESSRQSKKAPPVGSVIYDSVVAEASKVAWKSSGKGLIQHNTPGAIAAEVLDVIFTGYLLVYGAGHFRLTARIFQFF